MTNDAELLAGLLGEPVARLERVGRGRNSRVYRVGAASGEYAAKFYFQKRADGRDRLQTEFGAVSFLWELGLRCIARPILADTARQVALYGYVDGEAIELQSVSTSDLDQVAAFTQELKQIASREASSAIGPAAEAYFSVKDIVANIEGRLRRLEALDVASPATTRCGRSYASNSLRSSPP